MNIHHPIIIAWIMLLIGFWTGALYWPFGAEEPPLAITTLTAVVLFIYAICQLI